MERRCSVQPELKERARLPGMVGEALTSSKNLCTDSDPRQSEAALLGWSEAMSTSPQAARVASQREQLDNVETSEQRSARVKWVAAERETSKLRNLGDSAAYEKQRAWRAAIGREAGLRYYNLRWPEIPLTRIDEEFTKVRSSVRSAQSKLGRGLKAKQSKSHEEIAALRAALDKAEREFAAARLDPRHAKAVAK